MKEKYPKVLVVLRRRVWGERKEVDNHWFRKFGVTVSQSEMAD